MPQRKFALADYDSTDANFPSYQITLGSLFFIIITVNIVSTCGRACIGSASNLCSDWPTTTKNRVTTGQTQVQTPTDTWVQ